MECSKRFVNDPGV